MHFARLANTLLKDEESARGNHVIACNFAKYSPILNFFLSQTLFLFVTAFASLYQRNAGWPVSVCLSHVGVLSKRLGESSLFEHGTFLPPILHCVLKKFGYLSIQYLPWNFVINSGFRKFRHGTPIVATRCQLSSTKSDAAERDKLDRRRGQLS